MLFVDTSAFLALANEKDNNHISAVDFLENVKSGKAGVRKIIISFAIMKKRGIERVFSFDEDFKRLGFILLP